MRFIRFNFISYNQKKFDTSLSFLIPSDASNPTDCPIPLHVFSLPLHRSTRRRMMRSPAGACSIPMHFNGRLPSGSGPKDRIK
ncbi:hypothetical protein BCPG_03615 [Burkholderia cenocepacia PC184]|nr:hypothetical protein BCPG_03615 [Burkholderia cenocepacia PC184]